METKEKMISEIYSLINYPCTHIRWIQLIYTKVYICISFHIVMEAERKKITITTPVQNG